MFTNFLKNLNRAPLSDNEICLIKSDYNRYVYLSNLYLEIKYSYTPQVISKDYYDILSTSKQARSKINYFNPNNVLLLPFKEFVNKYQSSVLELNLRDKESLNQFELKVKNDINNNEINYDAYKRNLVNVKRTHFLSIFKNLIFIET